MNRQVNKAMKNKTFPKKSQYISLDWLYDEIDCLICPNTRIATIIQHEKWTNKQNNEHLKAFGITKVEVIKSSLFLN